jgi:hypothetical protein
MHNNTWFESGKKQVIIWFGNHHISDDTTRAPGHNMFAWKVGQAGSDLAGISCNPTIPLKEFFLHSLDPNHTHRQQHSMSEEQRHAFRSFNQKELDRNPEKVCLSGQCDRGAYRPERSKDYAGVARRGDRQIRAKIIRQLSGLPVS